MGSAVRRHAAALALALLLSACTGDTSTPAPPAPTSDPRVTGSILVRSGFGGTFELVTLPDGEIAQLRMPPFVRTLGGFFDDDGTVIGLLEVPGGARLYRLSVGGEPAPLGPRLPPVDTMSHGGGSVLVTGCSLRPFALVLALAAPEVWRPVDAGCGSAVSPDGRSAAWSPDGSTIVEAPLVGPGGPTPVTDIGDLPVPEAVGDEASFVGTFAWGPVGRAALISTEGWQGVATGPEPAVVASLGDRGSGPAQAYLDWQPDGPMLAIASSTTLGGIVRVVDRGEPTVVAMFGEPATGAVWSPDGRVLLAASNGVWAIVTPEGEWLWSRIEGGGQEPLDWSPG